VTDPLPSWRDGRTKSAILEFVEAVTREGGPDYVAPAERIAAFDNDGTLWCEQPMQVQGFFLADRVKQLAAADPTIAQRQPFKAFLKHDHAALHALGKQGILELFFATHAGMTEQEFRMIAGEWLGTALHPTLGRRFVDNLYRPQLELLAHLRDSGFRSFIVTGGGVDFVRAFAEQGYGIPPERVIGSSARIGFEIVDERPLLRKLAELGSFNDREAKPGNIGLHIGRRPILCFGNSDGDLAMLRYTLAGEGRRLGLLLHHDDAEREFAYDREFVLSPLAQALEQAAANGILLVSMKQDWATVFADPTEAEQPRPRRRQLDADAQARPG
jgi:phosphoglycolate phosphatase-like HAD superfamily hydrolase